MSDLLTDKVATVTGGSSGIGRSISLELAAQGASVVVADIQEQPRESGDLTAEVIGDRGGEATYVECDVTDTDDIEEAVNVADEFGGIDIMVNNAGIGPATPLFEVTEEEFDRTMAINTKGVFFGAQIAAKRMVDDGGGTIINLSSEAGIVGVGGFIPYCASKGAVKVMTYALADSLAGEEIRVNAIHPGIIETTMTTEDAPQVGTEHDEQTLRSIPSSRFGQPEDIADVAVFLASDLSDYVNGESIVVDGGLLNTA